MKHITFTMSDDLAEAVERYRNAQDAPPSLSSVMQSALRRYLSEQWFLREPRILAITPAP